MKPKNKLYYFLCVAVPAAALIFLTVSCEYIVDPDAPAWGEIVITSRSSVTEPDTLGYFSATGVLNIEEGVVTDYEWESEYTIDGGDGNEYYAEAGYVDFTGPGVQEEGGLLQNLGLKDSEPNSEGGWYSNLETMRVYMELVWGSSLAEVEIPELIPDMGSLEDVFELEWQEDKLTAMINYFDEGYYTTEYLTSDSFRSMAEKLPYMSTKFIYDSNGNLERECEGLWYDGVFYYNKVTVYDDFDDRGNPYKGTYYDYLLYYYDYEFNNDDLMYPENFEIEPEYILNYTIAYDEGRLVSLIIGDDEKHTLSYDENGSIKTLTVAFFDDDIENWGENTITLTFIIPEGITFHFKDIAPWTDPIGNLMIGTLLPPPPEEEVLDR